jgi:8-oxo-dGTP diphosphatase
MKSKFCNECGFPLENQVIEGRQRSVCTKCNVIKYENPLPVAAALLLNQEREVLLVKRKNQPRKGKWCLPMGFAELDETIAQAALRELEEETGVNGRVIRLVAARSDVIEIYGDLLIVTFEVEKIGGQEHPGDDAEDISYFSVNSLPEIAFEPNLAAIRYCLKAHEEEWAIKDSFKIFEEESNREMLSDRLVTYIRDNAKEVSERWLEDVLSSSSTTSYTKVDTEELRERVASALSQFKRWLSGSEADSEVKAFYRKLGADRREQGFKLHEIISSLSMLRKQVLTYARDHNAWGRTIDLYTLTELDRRNFVFFDKAIYYVARAFQEDGISDK